MTDIFQVQTGKDLGVIDSDIPKAANVLSVQLGELEYASDFGVDKKYFLFNEANFQMQSYKSYLVQRLVDAQINVPSVVELVERLFRKLDFYIGRSDQNVKGLIR